MPAYTAKVLTDAEITDVYAYLETVPEPRPWQSIPLLSVK
jgi:mono/diheme cytochrome c family protein